MTMPETTQSDLVERREALSFNLYLECAGLQNPGERFPVGGDFTSMAELLAVIEQAERDASEITRLRAHCDAMVAAVDNWDGLARSIMMAFDCGAKTPRAIFKHLSMAGQPVPKWMRDEAEMQNLDHTISKGTRCVLIYRAMAEPAVAAYRKENPDVL